MTLEVSFNVNTGIDTVNNSVDNVILEAFEIRLNITRFISVFNKYVTNLDGVLVESIKSVEQSGKELRRLEDLNESEKVPLYVTIEVKKMR